MSEIKELDINGALGVMMNLANKAACAYQYESWSDEFRVQQIKESHERMKAEYEIDPTKFSPEQLKSLGFGKWDEESNLYLAPLWVLPFLKQGLELTCIDGEKSIVGKDEIDNDIRFGCISYGITPTQQTN